MARACPDDEAAELQPQARLSPKAYSEEEWAAARQQEREDVFTWAIERERDKFFACVSESKPYLDFVTLITIHAALVGFFFALIGRMMSGGYSDRILVGTFALFLLWLNVIGPLNRALDAVTSLLVLKSARALRLPYPFRRISSASLAWLVAAVMLLTSYGVIVGTSFVGFEFAERTISAVKGPAPEKKPEARKNDAPPKAEPPPRGVGIGGP